MAASTDLRSHLADPNTPWNISAPLFERTYRQERSPYRKCELIPQDPEWNFVHQYFNQDRPTNRAIKHIYCIQNPDQTNAFTIEIRNMEQEANNPKFSPGWDKEDNVPLRKSVITRWKNETAPYSPFSMQINNERKEIFSSTRILPLWHGSDEQKCHSICSSGFSIFGKHAYVQGEKDTSSGDIGFFGSGIYFTNNARYAVDIYSNGHMLLAWVSMREPYPVIADTNHPNKPSDMKKLEGLGAYKNYNAHYVPVISIDPQKPMCTIYYPCTQNQVPALDEVVVFQKSQTLPRFWIELQVDLPAPVKEIKDNALSVETVLNLVFDLLEKAEVQEMQPLYQALKSKSKVLVTYGSSAALTPKDIAFYRLTQQLIDSGKKVRRVVAEDVIELSEVPSPAAVPKQTIAYTAPITLSVVPSNTLPSVAFGKAEWAKYFGDIGIEPPLPADINAILAAPCPFWPGKKVQETHLFVLVPQTVNGKPLTLKTLGELIQKPLQGTPTKYRFLDLGQYTDPAAPKSHWALMTRDVIEGSRNKSYNEQQALIKAKAPYEVPTLLDATVAILMEHVRTGTRLYSDSSLTYTRCQEKYNKNWQLAVGGFAPGGLFVYRSCGGGNVQVGVGGLRKFF